MIFFFRLNYPLLKWRYQESVYGTKLVGTWNSRPLHDDNRICYIVDDFRWRYVTGQTPRHNGPSLCWFRNRDPHSVSVPSEPRTPPPPPHPPNLSPQPCSNTQTHPNLSAPHLVHKFGPIHPQLSASLLIQRPGPLPLHLSVLQTDTIPLL